ncbi:MAG: GNAT family N-acetyltransferase [bacterium]
MRGPTSATDLRIRPFAEQDYPALTALFNAVYSDYPFSEEEARHDDARYDGSRLVLRRLVAVTLAGDIVGAAEFHHVRDMYDPQKFQVGLSVHPDHRRQGIGARLYTDLTDLMAPFDPVVLWAWTRETWPDGVKFAVDRGFREVRRAWESRLDVAAFDPAPFQARADAALEGLTVTTLAEEKRINPRWLQDVYELHQEVSADIPRPDTFTPQSLEQYQQGVLGNPGHMPEAHFLVKDGPRYTAESFMFKSAELSDVLYQGLTATRRPYRGRGVAFAVKLHTIAFARKHGAREIRTWNDTLNEPMLRINVKLGFARQPAWITFEMRL